MVGCHYFLPGLQLPPQPQSITTLWPVPSILLGDRGTQVRTTCPRLLRSVASSRTWTRDLLIVSPMLYPLQYNTTLHHRTTHKDTRLVNALDNDNRQHFNATINQSTSCHHYYSHISIHSCLTCWRSLTRVERSVDENNFTTHGTILRWYSSVSSNFPNCTMHATDSININSLETVFHL